MSPRFYVIYLSLVALVCTLVGAKESDLSQDFQEIEQQIIDMQGPVDSFVYEIEDESMINLFTGYSNSCGYINIEENADQQCPAVTSCLDHMYTMTKNLSQFFGLINEFLQSCDTSDNNFNASKVGSDLLNLQTNMKIHMFVNYPSPQADPFQFEITCFTEDECNLESKLGIGLQNWLQDMRQSTSILGNVTGDIQDMQQLLETCGVTSRKARSNKKKRDKKGKGKKTDQTQTDQEEEKLRRKKAKQDERKKAKAAERAAKAARKAAEKARRKEERRAEKQKQRRAQQFNN